jgi:predicted HTH domain antitoxin
MMCDTRRERLGSKDDFISTVTLEIPDETLLALRAEPETCAGELRMAAAVKLHELGRLSSGAAARLAGVPRVVFLARLADYGVAAFRETREEIEAEARLARHRV